MRELQVLKENLAQTYQTHRRKTEALCRSLEIEDYVIQSIEDVSPPKWHLAHTTWFFETFLLKEYLKNYQTFHPLFHHLFNSYYQTIGNPYPRVKRGLLSRPTVNTIFNYRHYVDQQVLECIDQLSLDKLSLFKSVLTLGLHHEQQHQELLLMDIKYNFSLHPDFPVYSTSSLMSNHSIILQADFTYVDGGIVEIGYQGNEFCFDNEMPRHQIILQPYLISTGLVTNAEYLEFIKAGGYQKSEWWLADGWDYVQKNRWQAPLYWNEIDNNWTVFTLNGLQALNPAEPVSHVSYYEADAYACYRGKRLCREAEWEHFAASSKIEKETGNFLESNYFHPQALSSETQLGSQLFGDLWEWTASSYSSYPGYRPLNGALGEYNGKFMSNQMVLRGGCCVTPQSHIRATYRNFFQPEKRWQFSGIRLASDIKENI